jgi:hypothetical protein
LGLPRGRSFGNVLQKHCGGGDLENVLDVSSQSAGKSLTLLVWPLIPFFSNSRKVVWVEGYTLPGRLEELDVFEAQLVFAIFAEIKLNIQLALGFRFVTQGFLGDVSEARADNCSLSTA